MNRLTITTASPVNMTAAEANATAVDALVRAVHARDADQRAAHYSHWGMHGHAENERAWAEMQRRAIIRNARRLGAGGAS